MKKIVWNMTLVFLFRKYRLMIKKTDNRPCYLSSSYIFLNCSARLSQINLIFAGFFSPCRYASDKYHKPNILLKKYFDSKWEMCPSRTFCTANPCPNTHLLTLLKHCSLNIFVRYIKKIAIHIIISNFPKNDPP